MRAEIKPGFLKSRRQPEKREMNEMELNNSVAGVMYRHLLRQEKGQNELVDDLNIRLNDYNLLKETFFTGTNFIMQRGLSIAEEAHKIQRRKFAGQPYLVHPLRVALLSIELAQAMGEPVTSELIIGALMHDVIEDSPRLPNKDPNKGYIFTEQTVESLFGNWTVTRRRAKTIATDSEAFNNRTAMENGELNDAKYYEKLKHPDRETFMRRQIIKAADRIDNLLDPLTLPEGLVNPRADSLAEKLQRKRGKYITETRSASKVLRLLLPAGSYLDYGVQTAANISERTLIEEGLTSDNWRLYFGSEEMIMPLITKSETALAA